MRELLLAILVVTSAGCSGRSGGGGDTRGDTCGQVAPSSCMYAIRCGAWAGTQNDCERATRYECCERDGTCSGAITVDSGQLETCLAMIRGAVCGTNPLESEACSTAITVPPPPMSDAGPSEAPDAFIPAEDAGPPSRLYLSCAGEMTCGAGEGCYTLSYTDTDFACTRPCSGPDDTSCAGGHCVRTRTAPRGETPMDGTAVCLESCSTDSDCAIAGWTCVMTATGFRVCLP